MTWREVAVIAMLVFGAVASHALGGKELAMVLAGAAAGYASHRGGTPAPAPARASRRGHPGETTPPPAM